MLCAGDLRVHHAATVPQTVCNTQPHTVRPSGYRIRMPTADPRTFLWANIAALMRTEDPTLDAVAAKTKIGRGTIQRIKEGEAATRISSLQSIAEAFDIEVWQFLVPGLDPDQPPRLLNFAKSVEARLAALEAALKSTGPAPTGQALHGQPNAAQPLLTQSRDVPDLAGASTTRARRPHRA